MAQKIGNQELARSTALEGIFAGSIDDEGDRLDLIIKTGNSTRDILGEKQVLAQLAAKAKRLGSVTTGAVRMYSSPDEYLVLESFGSDIRAYMNPQTEILKQNLKKLVGALDAVHDLGYMHGDMKPHNILMRIDTSTGVVGFKLCDFESARPFGQPFPLGKFTRSWVAPEVYWCSLNRQQLFATAFIDIFALGLIIACILEAHRSADMAILPQAEAGFHEAMRNQTFLNQLLKCGGHEDYRKVVLEMCR